MPLRISFINFGSLRISTVSCQPSYSSLLTIIATGFPLRVIVTTSARRSTASTNWLSLVLTSDRGMVFMVISHRVLVRIVTNSMRSRDHGQSPGNLIEDRWQLRRSYSGLVDSSSRPSCTNESVLFEKAQNVLVERVRIFEAASMAGAGNDVVLQAHWVLRYFTLNLIGVGNGSRRPRPPNRACGSPAHGSPVGGFLIGIGSPASRLYAW